MKRLVILATLLTLFIPSNAMAANPNCQTVASWSVKLACAYKPTAVNGSPSAGWFTADFQGVVYVPNIPARQVDTEATAQWQSGGVWYSAGASAHSWGTTLNSVCLQQASCAPDYPVWVHTMLSQGPGAGCFNWRTKLRSLVSGGSYTYPTTIRITYSDSAYFCS